MVLEINQFIRANDCSVNDACEEYQTKNQRYYETRKFFSLEDVDFLPNETIQSMAKKYDDEKVAWKYQRVLERREKRNKDKENNS